jgi:DNA-directed RNA polymerase specialized sigma24 family protein
MAPELDVLLALAARGEPAAWLAVYDQLVDAVYGYVYARVGRQAVAELVTERAFVQAWDEVRGGGLSSQGVLECLYRQVESLIREHQQQQPRAVAPSGAALQGLLARWFGELSPEQQVLVLRLAQRLTLQRLAWEL